MNEVFEKILERFDEKKQYFQKFYEADGKTEEDECINKATQLAFDDAKNIVEEVAEEYKDGWISVKDRLPDKAGSYLVIGKSGGATVTRWYMPSEFYPEGHFGGNSADYIRYWMPRPEPPKERD